MLDYYRSISTETETDLTKSNTNGIGGVDVLIKNERFNNIEQINRYSHRSVEIIMHTGINEKKLHILNTYAPNMRYEKEERSIDNGEKSKQS